MAKKKVDERGAVELALQRYHGVRDTVRRDWGRKTASRCTTMHGSVVEESIPRQSPEASERISSGPTMVSFSPHQYRHQTHHDMPAHSAAAGCVSPLLNGVTRMCMPRHHDCSRR